LDFVNHTPFPALAFAGLGAQEQAFHVVVLRQTFTFADGPLRFADEQTPLAEEDSFVGAPNESSVLAESDLCPFKPRCDVLVHATAHAPKGIAARSFRVRLRVEGPARDQTQLEQAQNDPLPGRVLIDKELVILGPRSFRRRHPLARLAGFLLKVGTLGLLRPNPWKLTLPEKIDRLPVGYAFAFGGQNKVLISDPQAERVKRKDWRPGVTPSELRAAWLATGRAEAVAHTHCDMNPLGLGFAQPWFLEATRAKALPAPQIEAPNAPITAKHFLRVLKLKLKPGEQDAFQPQGFGILAKAWSPRAQRLGTVDAAFCQSDRGLPEDFDPAYWNGAPADQQVPLLNGDETITLTNLCAPDAPCAGLDADGNTQLRLSLPGNRPFLLVRLEEGEMTVHELKVDTVYLDPEQASLVLVWRGKLPMIPEIRVLEARMLDREAQGQVAEIQAFLTRPPVPDQNDWKTAMMAGKAASHA
jgi:hypothetical protein